jgi:hypothetical protein
VKRGFILLLVISTAAKAQVKFSMGTDVSLLRNFSTNQQFTSFGQSVQGNVHLTAKQTIYGWLSYYLNSSFTNRFNAVAKDPATIPAAAIFRVKGTWKYNHISIGLKQYLYGSHDRNDQISIYGMAGFGLLFAKATNALLDPVDTALYQLPANPQIGASAFKRLTFDLGIGGEYPLGTDLFIYTDLRTWINTSSYPSAIFHSTGKAPVPVLLSVGLRALFGN